MTEWSLGLLLAIILDALLFLIGYKYWRKKREDNKQREPASPAG